MNHKYLYFFVSVLLGFVFIGCTKKPQPESEAETINLFQKGKGVWLPDETRKDFGVEVVEVTEKRLPKHLTKTAQVFRAPREGEPGQAIVSLSPEEAKELKPGQQVKLSAAGVAEMGGALVRLDGQIQAVSGMVEGIIKFAAENRQIDSGSFLTASFSPGEATAVLTVPESAVLDTAAGSFVYTENGKHLLRTEVKTGSSSDGFREIRDGLYAGDAVVAKGIENLWLVELSALKGGKPCCAVPKKKATQ